MSDQRPGLDPQLQRRLRDPFEEGAGPRRTRPDATDDAEDSAVDSLVADGGGSGDGGSSPFTDPGFYQNLGASLANGIEQYTDNLGEHLKAGVEMYAEEVIAAAGNVWESGSSSGGDDGDDGDENEGDDGDSITDNEWSAPTSDHGADDDLSATEDLLDPGVVIELDDGAGVVGGASGMDDVDPLGQRFDQDADALDIDDTL